MLYMHNICRMKSATASFNVKQLHLSDFEITIFRTVEWDAYFKEHHPSTNDVMHLLLTCFAFFIY